MNFAFIAVVQREHTIGLDARAGHSVATARRARRERLRWLYGLAVGDVEVAAFAILLEQHVQHARDGIGAVLCGRAVAKHFDALNRRDGKQAFHVHGSRATPHRAVDVEQGTHVPALAVDQHQCLIRPRPRKVAGRMMSVPPVIDGCGKL